MPRRHGRDFESLAKEAANIVRAKALPLYHPDFPGVQVPGVVTVVVVPDSVDPAPMPSDGTLRSVCAYLSVRRLLTTEVYVIAPTYQQVQINAEIVAQDTADIAEVNDSIQTALLSYQPATWWRGPERLAFRWNDLLFTCVPTGVFGSRR